MERSLWTENFLDCLDEARDIAGVQFKINSGYRTPAHNKKVGGLTTSSHLIGRAADIHCTHTGKRLKIIEALSMVGFQRFGIAKTFIHVDNDDQKKQAIWLYSNIFIYICLNFNYEYYR